MLTFVSIIVLHLPSLFFFLKSDMVKFNLHILGKEGGDCYTVLDKCEKNKLTIELKRK